MRAYYQSPVATPLQRLASYLVDWLIVLLLWFFVVGAFGPALEAEYLALFIVVQALYYVVPTITWGGTVSKLAMGLNVTRADGSPLMLDAILLRYLVFLVTTVFVPFGAPISFFILLRNPNFQALHDRIAGTMVLVRER